MHVLLKFVRTVDYQFIYKSLLYCYNIASSWFTKKKNSIIYWYDSVDRIYEHENGRAHDVKVLRHCSAMKSITCPAHGCFVCGKAWKYHIKKSLRRIVTAPHIKFERNYFNVLWDTRIHIFHTRNFTYAQNLVPLTCVALVISLFFSTKSWKTKAIIYWFESLKRYVC